MSPLNDPDAVEFIDEPSTSTPLRRSILNPLQERIFARIQALEAAVAAGGGGGTTLAGDAAGPSSATVVGGLHGRPLPAPGANENAKTFVYDAASQAYIWTALPSTELGGDLDGQAGSAIVVGIRQKYVPTPTAADDGKALVWNAAANAWALADVGSSEPPPAGEGTVTPGTSEGFEDNDLANWTVAKSSGVTVEVSAAARRTGSYGARIVKPYTASDGYARWDFPASNSVPLEGRLLYLTVPSQTDSNGAGLRLFTGGTRIVDVYRLDTTGGLWLRWRKADNSLAYAYLGVIVPLGEWVKIRLEVTRPGAGNVSTILVEINGTAANYTVSPQDATAISKTAFDLIGGNFDNVRIGSEHVSQHVHCYVDDLILPPQFVGTTYHVAPSGSDSNPGSSALPWRTVAKVNGATLAPGDRVLFQRGGQWNEALNITQSGTAARRLRIGAYGSGARPLFDGGGNFANGDPMNPIPGPWPTKGTRDPINLAGAFIVMEEFTTQQGNYSGLRVAGDDNIARRFTSRWNVAGLYTISGADRFEAHDYELLDNAVMSVNAAGGDDDSGAFAHLVHGADGYFHHGSTRSHRATSHDYGVDGSSIELYGGKRNRFAYIVSIDDEAFSELGHAGTEDTTYDHCIGYSLAGDGRIGLNVQGGNWGAPLRTTMIHCTLYYPAGTGNQGILFNSVPARANSTAYSVGQRVTPSLTNAKANGHIYEATVAGTSSGTEPVWPTNGGTVVDGGVTWIDRGHQGTLRNNIVVCSWKSGYCAQPVDENHSLYYGHSTQQMKSVNNAAPASDGVGTSSKLAQNPLFTSTSTPNLRLQAGSPAVDAGIDRGYVIDLDGNPRLIGAAPDMGAYERQA